MTTTNTPFENGVDELLHRLSSSIAVNNTTELKGYQKRRSADDAVVEEVKAALTQLHKAAIVAELEKIEPIASHQLAATVADRIEQYKKEGKDEQYT